ncbi:MAG: histidinol-phosphatase [Oscillospiraceae bacterium]|nr:histidinol-phosphatase [Oscillospiraceae bacterium]
MIANYHTHTFRCGHAEGDVADYAAEAEKAGLKILGMADHTPYDFFDVGPRDRPMRMKPEELPEYAEAVRAAAKEYAGRMEILLGVEAEYYPKYFPRLVDMLREHKVRYMILGQHFLGNEVDEPYCGRPWSDVSVLERYVAQSTEALRTRLFTYFAHPDLINFPGQDDVYEREMRRLCRAARETETPLEINLLGLREGRNYPDERFWRLAAEEGCAALLGCDAHRPEDLEDFRSERKALDMAERLGLRLLERVELKSV